MEYCSKKENIKGTDWVCAETADYVEIDTNEVYCEGHAYNIIDEMKDDRGCKSPDSLPELFSETFKDIHDDTDILKYVDELPYWIIDKCKNCSEIARYSAKEHNTYYCRKHARQYTKIKECK